MNKRESTSKNKRGNVQNLKHIDNTSEEINAAKSRGRIEKFRQRNLLYTARTLFENAEILPELVDKIKEEVQSGYTKNAIKLFDVIKEPEPQNINFNGGVEVQKVFIDAKTKKQTKQHISEFIEGQ